MPGPIKVYKQQLVKELKDQKLSNRQIAEKVGIHRNTVNAYVQRFVPNSDNPPTGSEAEIELFVPNPPTGSEATFGPDSACEPYRSFIEERVKCGHSAQRIHQDLVCERGFTHAYDSVKRFVRKVKGDSPQVPFRRMEALPGEEAQVDYGQGPWINQPGGRRKRSHVFRIVLSHSRKGYSEVSFHQTTESFIRSLENAFMEFGGVPQTLVIDNLKAAVSHPDWYDPELTKKVADFASFYGTTILPTKPYTPRHKGKVERGVDYVKENALKGRVFDSLDSANRFLRHWERNVADTRIHGTTREQVRLAYDRERPFLLPLPDGLFPCFEEAVRRVSMDGHVQVAKAYYSVPSEYVRHDVLARWDLRFVTIYDHNHRRIAAHARSDEGRFNTDPQHIPPEKRHSIEKGPGYLMKKVRGIGDGAEKWAEKVMANRGVQSYRTLIGLASMAGKHHRDEINWACIEAAKQEGFHLRHLRELLKNPCEQLKLEYTESHECIRELGDYQSVVENLINQTEKE